MLILPLLILWTREHRWRMRCKPQAKGERARAYRLHPPSLGSAASSSSSPQASANDCIVRRCLRGSAESVALRGRPARSGKVDRQNART